MKIIGVDNHASETKAEILHSEGYNTKKEIKNAHRICKELNKGLGDGPGIHYVVVPDDRRLWRGMEDLV